MTAPGHPVPMEDILATLPEERRKRIAQRARELIAEHFAEPPEDVAHPSASEQETTQGQTVLLKNRRGA
ncbi:hypothetical protein [Bosea sp. (in: a-proteobacteria)]|uniref:hypothetical protein n=1 Tax=Bosea sp. (in: a-proteobacteria) TaxID=1871050 RepID=UPI002735DF3C|nr:hypothetical protein [Bosea sp. (in: a-proteobacteria)]MDP3410560.1 hypothetical protein [Bosea sp. (in: a-proteobacteria)]